MDQHPVPRNISGFQFHLIGDMTLRQFVFLAIGAGCAFLLYKIVPLPTIFKVLLATATGFTGFAFAFIPVQERPLDKWLIAFFKSINSPTQYLWQKANIAPDILIKQAVVSNKPTAASTIEAHRDARDKLQAYLATLPNQPHQAINIREKNYIDKTLSLFENVPAGSITYTENLQTAPVITSTSSQTIPATVRSASYQPPIAKVETAASVTHPQIVTTAPPAVVDTVSKAQSIPQQTTASISPKSDEVKKELDQLTAEKEALMKELTTLKGQLTNETKPEIVKPERAKEAKPIISSAPQVSASEIGIPNYPQAPNIVVGVVKDTQKRILPNIIITIKDRAGTPLRALKTGRLGQFSTSTILANDTYFLEVEDPLKRYVFEITQIELTGKVFPPIEITAKGEKEIIREKLTKELFGSPVM